jgi:hypothetical protein
MYSLEFYAPDGEYVVEAQSDNLDELLERWANIGSRWIFYPIGVIMTPKGQVKVAPDGFEFLQGIYRKKWESCLEEFPI